MSILSDLLKSGDYKLPRNLGKDYFVAVEQLHHNSGSAYSLEVFKSLNGSCQLSIELPANLVRIMLLEYVAASFESLLTGCSEGFDFIKKELTSIDPKVYTYRNGTTTDTSGSEPNRDSPELQQGGVVDESLEAFVNETWSTRAWTPGSTATSLAGVPADGTGNAPVPTTFSPGGLGYFAVGAGGGPATNNPTSIPAQPERPRRTRPR